MDTDRNLLFGLLALQLDLIRPEQFIEACTIWSAQKNVQLGEVLVERSWILPRDKVLLDSLLERKLAKSNGDARTSLAGMSNDLRCSLSALGDEDIQNSLGGAGGLVSPGLAETILGPSLVQRDRYARRRLHAKGGMGQVWLAGDSDLGREIALKELRPELAADDAVRSRFIREARITGQLEHPGIVPVYELARHPGNEQPFYTMRFVRGRTLTEAILTYHKRRLDGYVDSMELSSLLVAFVAICNTIAYAHSRGVVHRDLKGQNIILGGFGEVLVVDWGLAKMVGQTDNDPQEPMTLVESDGSFDVELTLQGQKIGTPAFMAPEQAAGRVDLVGFRTDVYGLGAILYQILTGHTPFSGTDADDILNKVRNQELIPPRRLNDEVPVLLEAACLKALAKEPTDRFASASELAHAIEHWQELQRKQAELALRDSEALYHSLVDMLPLILMRKDLESRYTFANNRFCQSLGRPLEEIVGKTDLDFFPAAIAQEYQRGDRWVLETGQTLEATEENIDKGQMRYVQTIKTPIYDSHGASTGVQVICWDVSENKRLKDALEKATAELTEAQRQLKELAALKPTCR